MTRCVCATHGHCFDGMASAAIFSELLSHIEPAAKISYLACGYGPGQRLPAFDGEHNAILDYRYISDDHLTFYFDHHATAFQTADDRRHFDTRHGESARHFVWDPKSVSCSGLIARIATERFGVDLSTQTELVNWADRIDGARFETAVVATDRSDPVMRLAAVVERFGDRAFLARAVPLLRSEGVFGLSDARFVKDHYESLAPLFAAYEERIRARGEVRGRVALIDLTETPVDVVAKFSQYRDFPEATYSIIVAVLKTNVKISVGYNPWCGRPLDVNIGALCAEHGGGGHPVVGAISLERDKTSEALTLARDIALRIQTPDEESLPE